jgi:hypothetical protein
MGKTAEHAPSIALAVAVPVVIAIALLVAKAGNNPDYRKLGYSAVHGIALDAKVEYLEFPAKNEVEIGFNLGGRGAKVLVYSLFVSEAKVENLECMPRKGRYVCYQPIDIKQGDRIYKDKDEGLLCGERGCYMLVPDSRKGNLASH